MMHSKKPKSHRNAAPKDQSPFGLKYNVQTGRSGLLFWLSSCEVSRELCCNVGSSTLAGRPRTKAAQAEPTVTQGKFLMFLL